MLDKTIKEAYLMDAAILRATTSTAPSPRSSRNTQTENNNQYDMATERGLYSTVSIIHSVYYLSPTPTTSKKPTRQFETTQS